MKKLIVMMMLLPFFTFLACESNEDETEKPLKVKFEEQSISMKPNETYILHPIIESGNIDMDRVMWNSSNTEVAMVTDGTITAKSIGETNITISYQGKVCASCQVIVSAVDVSSVTLNQYNLDISIGESIKLEATIEPQNATNKEIVWESSDENIATVSDNGIVNAVNVGNTIIKAIAINSNIYAECKITVIPKRVIGITCQENVKVPLYGSVEIVASTIPSDASDCSISWTSSNPEIATVTEDGQVVGLSFGETTIIAKTTDGGFEAICNVEVCEIDEFVTVSSSHGTEGSTNIGFYSYLKLCFKTNTNSMVKITSIQLADENLYLKNAESPDIWCNEYEKKYITFYHGTSIGSTFKADGWRFIIRYIWNNKEYEIIHIHHAGNFPI